MKKKILTCYLLIVLIITGCIQARPAFAYSQEPAPNEAGYPAYVSIRLQRQPRTGTNVHEIFFYNIETGVEYYVEFNPFNFKHETIWFEYINLPLGTYEISGGVFQDVGAKFSLYTDNALLTLSEGVQEISCLIGDREWLKENKDWKWDVDEYRATLPTPTPTAEPDPSPTPVPTLAVEDDQGHIIYITPTPVITSTPTPVPTIPPIEPEVEQPRSPITTIFVLIVFVLCMVCIISFTRKVIDKKREEAYYDEPDDDTEE